ncbi:MAG: hypothetical protein H6R18_1917 [Proteobacteria bacterium]|nr:hypothetical protein [Pseudomonadota bacterium]
MLPAEQTTTAATLILEDGFLRASLRVEVLIAHPSFFPESCPSDLRKNAEEKLPVVLLKVAPPALRQILAEAESLLLQAAVEDRTSFFSLMTNQAMNDTTGGQS